MAVVVLGVVSLAESLWGVTQPDALRSAVRRVLDESPDRNPALGLFFLALGAVLWLFLSPDATLADYILLLYSWLFVGGGLVNFRAGALRHLMEVLLLRRSLRFVRLFYAAEFLWACALLAVGLAGR